MFYPWSVSSNTGLIGTWNKLQLQLPVFEMNSINNYLWVLCVMVVNAEVKTKYLPGTLLVDYNYFRADIVM
jgi:hypothetical protein